jgi:hypothetical protein
MEFTPEIITQMVQQFGTTFVAVIFLIWYLKKMNKNGDYGPQLTRIESKVDLLESKVADIHTDVEVMKAVKAETR